MLSLVTAYPLREREVRQKSEVLTIYLRVAQFGSASDLGSEGRGFKSHLVDHMQQQFSRQNATLPRWRSWVRDPFTAPCIVSVAATSRSSKPWSWVQIPYDTPSSVPEWLGTALEKQGGVTAYRVRFSGARPYTPIIQWQNRRLLIVLSQFNSGWEYHISHQASEETARLRTVNRGFESFMGYHLHILVAERSETICWLALAGFESDATRVDNFRCFPK